MNCPRCGRSQPPQAQPSQAKGAFCAYCGQFLIPTRWVALTPDQAAGRYPVEGSARTPYAGPPSYPAAPRWGFAPRPWNRASEQRKAAPVPAVVGQAGLLVPLLWGTAALAVVAAGAELWRYVLLVRSRGGALDAGEVAASDALVQAAGWVTMVMAVVSGVLMLLWVQRAVVAAAEGAGVRAPRSARAVLLGWLVPGVNLAVPGSVLAELEHAALGGDRSVRPSPSRLVRLWWALWAGSVVLAAATIAWSLRSGVQAMADAVVLHALVNLLLAVTAVVTARVVIWLTALLGPPREIPLPRVVRVGP